MNKTGNVWFGLLLTISLLLSLTVSAWAEPETETEEPAGETLTISTLEEFLTFSENCRLDSYSQNLTVVLANDIDLTSADFDGVPIFSGTFEGCGYTITGLSIDVGGSDQGLFRYLTSTAVVRDLTVEGVVTPSGSRGNVGGIAGSNAGFLQNCSFSGRVSGGDGVGGLVGFNEVTGVLENCQMEGSVQGVHFIGGLAGENQGVIRSCENHAEINITPEQNSVELSDVTLETLTDSESAGTVTDIGGISGGNTGVIRDCVNHGTVGYRQMGYNIGGISGSQSGYITGCVNYGPIGGRKEVGGIVGQMEPSTTLEFETDTLQVLQGQVNSLAGLTQQMSYNTQSSTAQLGSQINALEGQIRSAQSAIDQMIPGGEDSSTLPDLDSLLAAQNTLSSSLTAMSSTVESMAATGKSAASTLSNDINAISNQISAIGGTLGNSSEQMGGSITDTSDADTEDDTTGKVENCRNYGDILADLNAGGIVGAMSLENDLDPEDDVEIVGNTSLNYNGELRVVVLNCENRGDITANKRRVGGIVGWMPMGLVRNCLNTGSVHANSADHVGGIAGQSRGYIRLCSVKCALAGKEYVGGIAGEGITVTDCRSMTEIQPATEKMGGVLGDSEDRTAIQGNFYLPVGKDLGAIDGISYAGSAGPLTFDSFFALEGLNEAFRTVTVTFLFEDGSLEIFSVPTGGALEQTKVPDIPEKEGYRASWEGLEDSDLTRVNFNTQFKALYTQLSTTIASDAVRESGQPLLLVEGAHFDGEIVTVSPSEEAPLLKDNQTCLEVWELSLPDLSDAYTLRYQLPQDVSAEDAELMVRGHDGTWRTVTFRSDGSYLVFDGASTDCGICLIYAPGVNWLLIGGICGGCLVAAAVTVVLIKRRKVKQPV